MEISTDKQKDLQMGFIDLKKAYRVTRSLVKVVREETSPNCLYTY